MRTLIPVNGICAGGLPGSSRGGLSRVLALAPIIVALLFFFLVCPKGSAAPVKSDSPVVQLLSTPDGNGYWQIASDGSVFNFGSAKPNGSLAGVALAQPVVGATPTPSGNGYWLVASDGGIFTFGDAQFFGSTGGIALSKPVVGMAATPSGNGYWLVASDGGIFTFGDAGFYGSTGNITLNKPVVGMAATPSGRGYWLAASDGGVFSFGDAKFFGSTGSIKLNQPVVGMARTNSGHGYWLYASDGGVFTFGDAKFFGNALVPDLVAGPSIPASVTCAPGTFDVGLRTGYLNAKPVSVRLCAIPGLPSSGEESTRSSAWYVGADHPGLALVNSQVSAAYRDLVADARASGKDLRATSSFRTMPHQQSLRRQLGAKAALPGKSNHQMGLAIDVAEPGNPRKALVKGGKLEPWLVPRARARGFFQNYAVVLRDKKKTTGEPWHFSPTGY